MQESLIDKFIHGNSSRLFLNTELGCASSCSYCYLPVEGFPIGDSGQIKNRATASEILARLSVDPRVILGPSGTVFSIGCFSECWDKNNRSETISLILGLLPFGNTIQLATKRQIKFPDLEKIVRSPSWQGQLGIYISSATVSHWNQYERGTTIPRVRFESFEACRSANVKSFLYIKPVLPGITINDVAIYGNLMEKYQIDAIVGDHFFENSEKIVGIKSPISQNLTVLPHSDAEEIRNILSKYGNVYKNSTQN